MFAYKLQKYWEKMAIIMCSNSVFYQTKRPQPKDIQLAIKRYTEKYQILTFYKFKAKK